MPVAGDWDGPLPQLASAPGPGTSMLLTQQQLDAEVQGALARLQQAGADAATLDRLESVHYVVGQLSGDRLGQAALYGDEVMIDASADGWGWFVDPAPWQNTGVVPANRMDLLTTVLHEMGHIVGLGDLDLPAGSTNVMNEWLTSGARHTGALDAFWAGHF